LALTLAIAMHVFWNVTLALRRTLGLSHVLTLSHHGSWVVAHLHTLSLTRIKGFLLKVLILLHTGTTTGRSTTGLYEWSRMGLQDNVDALKPSEFAI
jgi:hypothetical protein